MKRILVSLGVAFSLVTLASIGYAGDQEENRWVREAERLLKPSESDIERDNGGRAAACSSDADDSCTEIEAIQREVARSVIGEFRALGNARHGDPQQLKQALEEALGLAAEKVSAAIRQLDAMQRQQNSRLCREADTAEQYDHSDHDSAQEMCNAGTAFAGSAAAASSASPWTAVVQRNPAAEEVRAHSIPRHQFNAFRLCVAESLFSLDVPSNGVFLAHLGQKWSQIRKTDASLPSLGDAVAALVANSKFARIEIIQSQNGGNKKLVFTGKGLHYLKKADRDLKRANHDEDDCDDETARRLASARLRLRLGENSPHSAQFRHQP
jgi:hypothetical protein